MVDRKNAPEILDPVSFDIRLKPYEKFILDNGIPVYTIAAGTQDTMMLELVFKAGNWYEKANLEAAAANHLMKNGTARYSALQINERVEYYGAFLDRACHHEHGQYSLHCLTKHIAGLLPVLREVITSPVYPEEELAIYRQNMKQHLSVNLRKCEFVANRRIDEYLFGSAHPYGRFSSMEAYDSLDREILQNFYRTHYTFDNCTIFAAGNLPADFAIQLNDCLGKDPWNGTGHLRREGYSPQPASEKIHRLTNDPEGVQGAVRIARPFPNRYHPDFPKMQVLNTIFGGYFGSRLMSNIREDKGYTYGIHSHLYNFQEQSAFTILTEAGRDVCEATLSEIYLEMERMTREPVGNEELQLVRNYLIGTVLADLDGPFQLIQRWRNLIMNGLDEQYFYHNIQTIKTISAEELLGLSRTYFNRADFYELIVI